MLVPLKSSARLNIPMLPKGQPHTEHHLGSAKDPHPVRLLDEPHPNPTGALGANHPEPRMLLRSQELYEPIPDREYREALYESPLPHSALLLLFLCTTKSLPTSFYDQYSQPVRKRQDASATVVSGTRIGEV